MVRNPGKIYEFGVVILCTVQCSVWRLRYQKKRQCFDHVFKTPVYCLRANSLFYAVMALPYLKIPRAVAF
jgi:hypothetical protein